MLVSCQPKESNSKFIQPQVKIAGISSGNTLNVIGIAPQPNVSSQVRLIGVDAPDRRQNPWGEKSSRRLQELIGDKLIKLEFDLEEKDRFGRTLAYVWQDEILLNEQLVKEGYALFVPRSPNHKYDLRLERAQQFARLMGKGIWDPEKPMRLTPAEFRRIYR
ncbi:MAG: thermonuclease family protein [Mastigocoleus sp. MO_167.B18]|nr:thermonuclease family protein [Mastigocoleus sp. MO_167.B18]